MDNKILLLILFGILTLAFFVVAYILASNYIEKQNENNIDASSNKCAELGCPENSTYIGSVNSDKYYECECHYAETILPENIICFASDDEAITKGYVKVEC